MADERQTRRSGHGRAVLIAVALVSGWLLHDLLIVVGSASFGLAGRIMGRSFLVALAVGVGGMILMRLGPRIAAVIGALIVSGALGVTILRPTIDPAFIGLAKTILLLVLATGVMAWAGRLRWWSGVPAGVILAAAATAARRLHWGPITDRYLLIETALLIAGLSLVLALFIRRPRRRQMTAILVIVLACTVVVAGAGYGARLGRADIPAPPNADPGSAPNVLLISLDTVRADHLAQYGYFRSTMPGVEAVVAEEFDVYSQARSTSSWTLPSHGSLLTGLMPSEHGATHTRQPEEGDSVAMRWSFANRLRDDVPTLAEQLRDEGYRTAAIVANDTVLNHTMGLDRGFFHYDDRPGGGLQCRQLLVQQLGWDPQFACLPYRDATTVTDLALSWLRGEGSRVPFFLFLNYMDAHEPYTPPSPFAEGFEATRLHDRLKPPPELQSLQYDRELLYLDSQLSRLWDRLRADGRWENTVIVVTSDHGEAFGEHGHWGHAENLYEELIRVPLFVKGAGEGRSPRRTHRPIGGHQVPDLIFRELGLDFPSGRKTDSHLIAEWYGSLAPVEGRPPVSRDLLAWLEGSLKVIVSTTGDLEAYDLDVDGKEQEKRALGEPEMRAFRQRSREYWENRRPGADAADLSPEMLGKLRALGYLPAETPGVQ